MGAELSDEFAALVRSFREHAPATSAPELVWTLPPEWGEADLEARYWREAHASGIFELEMVSSHAEFSGQTARAGSARVRRHCLKLKPHHVWLHPPTYGGGRRAEEGRTALRGPARRVEQPGRHRSYR